MNFATPLGLEFAVQDARSRERDRPIGCQNAASRSVTYARFDLGRGRDPPEGSPMTSSDDLRDQLDSLHSISVEIAALHEISDIEQRALDYCLQLTGSEFG